MENLDDIGSNTPSRWLAVGQSSDRDSARAGESAAAEALIADDAQLLLVFCSQSYDLDELLDAINRRSGGVPLIGCSTAGEIATNGPGDAGVVVTALGGPGFAVTTASAVNASADLRVAGSEVAQCVGQLHGHPHRLLMLL